MRMKKQRGAERFVMTWQTSSNVKEVAEKLGVSYAAAHSRAHLFRRRGVKLKTMVKCDGTDWNALRALAIKCRKREG